MANDLTLTWAGDYEGTGIWMGEDHYIAWTPYAPWEELYHEEDFQGIADQLLAEELYDI